MINFIQKFNEINMTWGFFFFICFIIFGILLIVLFENWIMGIISFITAFLSVFRQMALLSA